MRNLILIPLFLLFFSCRSGESSNYQYEEAKDIFARGLAEGKFNFQIKDEDRYMSEFNSLADIDIDSAMNYALRFRSLIQSNFHLEGESLEEVFTRKSNFDSFDEKYRNMGFKGVCDAKKQYDELYEKRQDQFNKWLTNYQLEKEEIEADMITISIHFGRVCRTTQYKEEEKGKYFD